MPVRRGVSPRLSRKADDNPAPNGRDRSNGVEPPGPGRHYQSQTVTAALAAQPQPGSRDPAGVSLPFEIKASTASTCLDNLRHQSPARMRLAKRVAHVERPRTVTAKPLNSRSARIEMRPLALKGATDRQAFCSDPARTKTERVWPRPFGNQSDLFRMLISSFVAALNVRI